ncbi:MAG: hypothetical protein ACE5KZ_13910 [Candidatus Scalinduaceae bacterium]
MSSEWQTIQSFEESQEVLSAVNALSIHLKLKKAGISYEEPVESIEESRKTIISFLEKLESINDALSKGQIKPVLGINTRFRQLGNLFIKAKKNTKRFHSALFLQSPSYVINLIHSDQKGDQDTLLNSLKELGLLLEEHIYVDTKELLGEI